MGVADFLKLAGMWFTHEGTVFGGPLGNGVLGKVVFVVPYKSPRIEPPKPHAEGHYHERIEPFYELGYNFYPRTRHSYS